MQNLTVLVHFVISKWDLLDGKFTLSQIREKLLTIPAFAQLIKNRGEAGSIVRIVESSFSPGAFFFIWSITAGAKSRAERANVEVGDSSVGELI